MELNAHFLQLFPSITHLTISHYNLSTAHIFPCTKLRYITLLSCNLIIDLSIPHISTLNVPYCIIKEQNDTLLHVFKCNKIPHIKDPTSLLLLELTDLPSQFLNLQKYTNLQSLIITNCIHLISIKFPPT